MLIRLLVSLLAGLCLTGSLTAADTSVTKSLNDNIRKQAREESTGWQVLFDAYLDMTDPPIEIGDGFNQTTVWTGMKDWKAVSDWASSNASLADALKTAAEKVIIGLPYGAENVDARFREAGLVADVRLEAEGEVVIAFPYLKAFRAFSTWTAAELYRRIEAGEYDEGFDAAVANARVLRHLCDRQMLDEKSEAMMLLSEAMIS